MVSLPPDTEPGKMLWDVTHRQLQESLVRLIGGRQAWDRMNQEDLLVRAGCSQQQAATIMNNRPPSPARRRTRGGADGFRKGKAQSRPPTAPPATNEWSNPAGYGPSGRPSRG
jgi:hypothetical protein